MIHKEKEIIQWAIDRNILGPTGEGTKYGQVSKTLEEVIELNSSIFFRNKDGVCDAIGDIVVTLMIQAEMWGMTMEECIEAAWQQIKDRKGRMVEGIFVKDIQYGFDDFTK